MNIDKLVWALESYKDAVGQNNRHLRGSLTVEDRNHLEGLNKVEQRKLESIFNECVDKRVRAVLKELGVHPT